MDQDNQVNFSSELIRKEVEAANDALGRDRWLRSLRLLKYCRNEINALLKQNRYRNHSMLEALQQQLSKAIRLERLKRAAIALFVILLMGSGYLLLSRRVRDGQGTIPAIAFTKVPESNAGGPDTSGTIAGTVTGVDPAACKIVLYVRTDHWYVQPTVANPYTTVAPNGRWELETHLGRKYAAFLVRNGYIPGGILDSPPPVGGDVIAAATTDGK